MQNTSANLRQNTIYLILDVILFCIALANFISLWINSNVFVGAACVAYPWYYEWSYLNEPTIILVASYFLLYNIRARYFVSITLCTFILTKGIYLITKYGWIGWMKYLAKFFKSSQEFEIDILRMWEVQLLLAAIIMSFSVIALIKNKTPENITS